MYQYTVVQWLFFFYFYCFFGWCFESTYVSLKSKRPVNRGFMRGPFLPLYGSGGIMMLLVSRPFQDNLVMVFIAGCVGATVLEYVTGVVMEALFKVRYWDYSNQKFNFQGHICLSSSQAGGTRGIYGSQRCAYCGNLCAHSYYFCGFCPFLQGSYGPARCADPDGKSQN